MPRLTLLPFACLLVACSPTAPAEAPSAPPAKAVEAMPITVGVLEDRPGATTAEASRFIVRAVFQQSEDRWVSLESACNDLSCLASLPENFPASVDWTVTHEGKPIGSVRASTPAQWQVYADVGSQEIVAGAQPPKVGERTMEFAGNHDAPLHRPLVAVSAPAVSDPDAWSPTALPTRSVDAIKVAFRGLFANVRNCATEGGEDPRAMTYRDSDIVISKGAAAGKGWSVATAQLSNYRCDGPWDDTAFAPQAFAVSPEGQARYLGEGLQYLDAADFDGDGKSEVVFVITSGNRGGYEMRFNDFAGQAVFAFNYH